MVAHPRGRCRRGLSFLSSCPLSFKASGMTPCAVRPGHEAGLGHADDETAEPRAEEGRLAVARRPSGLPLGIIVRVGFETRMAMIRGGGVVTIPVGVVMIPVEGVWMRRRVRRRIVVWRAGHFVDDRRAAEVDPACECALLVGERGCRQTADQQSGGEQKSPSRREAADRM